MVLEYFRVLEEKSWNIEQQIQGTAYWRSNFSFTNQGKTINEVGFSLELLKLLKYNPYILGQKIKDNKKLPEIIPVFFRRIQASYKNYLRNLFYEEIDSLITEKISLLTNKDEIIPITQDLIILPRLDKSLDIIYIFTPDSSLTTLGNENQGCEPFSCPLIYQDLEEERQEEKAEFLQKFYNIEIPNKKNKERVCLIRFLDMEKIEEESPSEIKMEGKIEEF